MFTLNGTEGEQELDVAAVNLAYSGSNAGYPWHLEYARPRQDDNPNSNKYRNVMLYAEQTTLYNLCTLTYTLTGATFSET